MKTIIKILSKLLALAGRAACRFGQHDAVCDGSWGIRCSRCGKTGHYYDREYWDN